MPRISTPNGFREFVVELTALIKEHEMTGLFTVTTSSLFGSPSVTEEHFSTVTDTIIMLRYVEMFGELARGITVLKMRGSMHDKSIREFRINSAGLHIGAQFHQVSGILTGSMQYASPNGTYHDNRADAMDES